MEKSNQLSFLRSLAIAFGDGLLFGVAVKLVQGSTKPREEEMTGLGRLAERLRKMEDHDRQVQTMDGEALMKPGEGFDRRVLDKVIVALEARLTEHVGHVERRIAEMDAQTALDLKAVLNQAASQNGAFEKAVQQIESEVRASMEAAQRHGAEQISGVDEKLTALQDALPAKFREIVDAGAASHGSAAGAGAEGAGGAYPTSPAATRKQADDAPGRAAAEDQGDRGGGRGCHGCPYGRRR